MNKTRMRFAIGRLASAAVAHDCFLHWWQLYTRPRVPVVRVGGRVLLRQGYGGTSSATLHIRYDVFSFPSQNPSDGPAVCPTETPIAPLRDQGNLVADMQALHSSCRVRRPVL
jgi:hypothetical protein